jgi:hypothetical protein
MQEVYKKNTKTAKRNKNKEKPTNLYNRNPRPTKTQDYIIAQQSPLAFTPARTSTSSIKIN